MNINQQFAIWCARKCLHMWEPPQEVLTWLDNPENFRRAIIARRVAAKAESEAAKSSRISSNAARVTWRAIMLVITSTNINDTIDVPSALITAGLFNTTTNAIKFEFVSTLNDEELKTTDINWIDYVTVEIFNR